MAFSAYEIGIEDELWEAVCRETGLTDPSEIANLALKEMIERYKRRQDRIAISTP